MIVNRSATSPASSTMDIVPDWFARGRRRRDALAAAAAAQTVESRREGDSPWTQRALDWLLGGAAVGYAVSLFIHFLLLAVFSLIVLHAGNGGSVLSTELGVEEEGAEEFLDTRAFEVSSGLEGAEEPIAVVDSVPLPMPEMDLQVATAIAPELNGVADGDGESDATSTGTGAGPTFELPRGGNAVHQGSFTAWTVPADPRVGQDYLIVVEVEIPKETGRYTRADLAGQLVGTDGYKVLIPDGREFNGLGWSRPRRQPAFRREGNKARIVFFVRGAHTAMVRDTILIRSHLLDEQQKLQIVF